MRLWPRSLIARILILELGAIVVAAIALPILLTAFLHGEVNRYQLSTLADQAHSIARSIAPGPNGAVVRLEPDLSNAYASPYDGRAYVIADAAGHFLAGSAYADLVPWRQAPRGDGLKQFRAGVFIGVSLPVRIDNNRAWVIVTQDEAGPGAILDDVVRAFVRRYDSVLIPILLLLPLINSMLIARLIFAVRTVSDRAAAIGPQNLDVRLEEGGLPIEVAPLARATNALLVRLQESFRQQSEFVANVAHELRTPLAAHKVELEGVDDAELRARLSRSADRLSHVVTQLQNLAALETAAEDQFERFDAGALAREVIEEYAPQILAAGDMVELDLPDTPVTIRGNRSLAALALANLLVNATRHTPSGTSILVEVSAAGSITVRDNGPGIESSRPEESTRRYWRADHRRSDSAGLGLSIVKRIMEVHRGNIAVASQPGKGSSFELRFQPD